MGDHRISLKLQFDMHGHTAKNDWWLNWSDDIPERVAEWVSSNQKIAMDKFWEHEHDWRDQQAALKEKAEREQYEFLKSKYGVDEARK